MSKKVLYEGKAKIMYETENPDELLVYYKDDATAGNGAKKGTIVDKGVMNNKITSFFFDLLKKNGIDHHSIRMPSDREMIVKKLEIIPLEVVVRNIAAGNHYHVKAMAMATDEEIREIERQALKVNEIMMAHLKTKKITLVDFKLEFGRDKNGTIILADEISPDNCRFWDSDTNEKLDKDRFRRDLGNVEDAYKEILRRLTGEER